MIDEREETQTGSDDEATERDHNQYLSLVAVCSDSKCLKESCFWPLNEYKYYSDRPYDKNISLIKNARNSVNISDVLILGLFEYKNKRHINVKTAESILLTQVVLNKLIFSRGIHKNIMCLFLKRKKRKINLEDSNFKIKKA